MLIIVGIFLQMHESWWFKAEEWIYLLSVEKLCPVFTPKPQMARSSTGSLKCNWLQAFTLRSLCCCTVCVGVCAVCVCISKCTSVCLCCAVRCSFLRLEEQHQGRDSSCPSDTIPKIKVKKRAVRWLKLFFLDKVRLPWTNTALITWKHLHQNLGCACSVYIRPPWYGP